ncbi:MAG: isoprenylcysteine carboxylmethyltransferase family protein [Candidatus Cloacimonadales bacterium]
MNKDFIKMKKFRTRFSKLVLILLIIGWIFGKPKYQVGGLGGEIVDVIGLILCTTATLGRIWCAFYISGFKNRKVVSDGPYSMSRNPLYLYSLLGAIGIGLVTDTISVLAFVIVAFAIYYPFVIIGEEKKLEVVLGQEYLDYKKSVPRFFPKFSLLKQPKEYVVKPKVFFKDLKDCTMFLITFNAIILINALKNSGIIPTFFNIY